MEDAVPILDVQHLARLRVLGEDPEGLAELIQRYLSSIGPQLAYMRELLAAGNAEALEKEAHGLAGSSAMYGLPRVSRSSRALMARAQKRHLEGAEALLDEVARAFEEARPRLLAELSIPE
jgi:HPt (histidine-containing phosphotransfer) domain-containing protein